MTLLNNSQHFQDCEGCPKMVVVPAGTFTMGSLPTEAKRDSDEGPVHDVTIPQPFAVGVYPVTFDEWGTCVQGSGCNRYQPEDYAMGRGSRPVISVSWEDAQGYVKWLREKTGNEYRLLSEAEWEYVARAGSRTAYHWGEHIRQDQANYCSYGSRWDTEEHLDNPETELDLLKSTLPVGSFPANEFGLHDVHGNVWEWVEDCWNNSYRDAPSDGSAWYSGDCSLRVLRGGSWGSEPKYLRSANRYKSTTKRRNYNIGFRVARTLNP